MKKTVSALVTGLVAGGGLAVLVALLAPATAAQAAAAPCTAPGDLYAASGSTTLGTQSVAVWGYSATAGSSVSRPGGPTLCVNAGDTVTVTLHNQLTESTALLFQGQQMVPDRVGAAPGASTSYTFTASRPGTYLYEAGLVPNGQHQVAMGLYGALIVRPAISGQAYDATTAFDDEAVLVLSEIDPALNNAANPAAFDMRKYAPRYSLINGKAYPNTDPIPATAAGNKVLLRYVNAGSLYHSLASLGTDQKVIALDGSPLKYSRHYIAETFGPGQTADAVVTTPAATASLNRLPIYDGSLLLHNSNAAGAGGMLTFVTVPASGVAGPDTSGPATSSVAFAAGTLSATVNDTTTGGSSIAGAEYFIDTVTGTGLPMTGSGAGSVNVTASVSIPSGQHIVYVRGQDSVGNRGFFSSVLVTGGDATGPTTKSPSLAPSLTNGAGAAVIAVHATGDDTATGGSNITAAEYFIDAVGPNGSGPALAVNTAAPTASLDATIPAATVNALAEGTHVVSVHSQDAAGNWGAPVTISLVVDKTAPTTSGVSVAPTPNNGTLAFNGSPSAIRVTVATMADPIAATVNSTISSAEAFLDTVTANGSGIVVRATDAVYNSPSEAGYFEIPLATIALLADGNHTISVHAKDAAGNWGAVATTTLVIDKVKPAVSAVTVTPNPTGGAASVTLTAQATDAGTGVTRAEWFTGADPGVGNATAMTVTGTGPWTVSSTIDARGFSEGARTLTVRVRDAAGNWSVTASAVLQVQAALSFSTLGNTNPAGVGGTADDADIYSWSGTAFSRVIDASIAPYNLPGAANVDGFDRVSPTQFYVSFADPVNVPGIGVVQDEDVVFFNGTSWSLFFAGSAHGLGGNNNLDVDAISVVGSTLYFSTLGNSNPPGVGGTADDADIYSWNGTAYSRVIDASAAPYGLPAAANVDGFVRVDATHFYLSFSADTTTVPVLGAVQDEDVIYYNAGTWSVYFDGTAHGLTTANQDLDAFDVP
ncbi:MULTISPECIES: multicopper oxidase family protein [unclassified Cryobacterium]|uniref:multicopper oxidase family protein n=1 Tax=unclassified Cryobacterium TaxID=2649013 RepID=UPI002AB33F8D|nr:MULTISPECIES: multicopper oxidase family protein [unclassified Cryobacterium]MDY7529879.1 multicopper oxidase family protein [Cryobacterium sp. 10C2]MDY7557984.1 multicopper oxidase family protein [Cryobacterium sp. 10C3]MEB0291902.1 multicopper oxidase family protein [Cryobacterium sp. 10C2]